MTDRVTRPVTPFVEIVSGSPHDRVECIRRTGAGDVVIDDGRVLLRIGSQGSGHTTRILLDPDADLYGYLARTAPADLRSVFEVHLSKKDEGLLPSHVRGLTVVLPWQSGQAIPNWPDVSLALSAEASELPTAVPAHVSEVQITISDTEQLPEQLAAVGVPVVVILPLHRYNSVDALPPLFHGMGTGRFKIREIRLRIDPRSYQIRDRRAPFCSEVAEAIASAAGCNTGHLARELAFRERVMHRGCVRHLRSDPYFVTWLFQGHPTRGLVPAAANFPVPRRASRRELLRAAPDSEHQRLVAYLDLLESPESRLCALAERNLYAVSVHYLPNPDLPLRPEHGGIVRTEADGFQPLT